MAFVLDAADMRKEPEEVFEVLELLGKGSYGSVHKATHRATSQLVAIKQVPVDKDLQEIIKEINMLQQCSNENVVKYYGSFFKNSDLWIIMELCSAGSVADIMRLRKKVMNEIQIAAIIDGTLRGLHYLHSLRKIHRDVKAGNILLDKNGLPKLADFGVAAQLETNKKRNTVIGTPFWMAPEVIKETGYDERADIWSLGITVIEMAEGKPPYSDVHPMRVIFMIPSNPAPTLETPETWSDDLRDLIAQCLVKDPEQRLGAAALLQHHFLRNAVDPRAALTEAIEEALRIGGEQGWAHCDRGKTSDSLEDFTLKPSTTGNDGLISADDEEVYLGTMIITEQSNGTGAMIVNDEDTGTMNFNDSTLKVGCDVVDKPAFMQHFEKHGIKENNTPDLNVDTAADNVEYDIEKLSIQDLRKRLEELQPEMEREIAELKQRYSQKMIPISDAIAQKKKEGKG